MVNTGNWRKGTAMSEELDRGIKRDLEANVERGVALLDMKMPNWWEPEVINLYRLALVDCENCILGQAAQYLGTGVIEFLCYDIEGYDPLYGFDIPHDTLLDDRGPSFHYLDLLWANVIEKRRAEAGLMA
jgi:hypothetical protein